MLKRIILLLAIFSMSMAVSATPSFSFTDVKGQDHTLEGYRGKWVLVNLWATWCSPCLAEMPELESLSRSRQDLVVLGIAVDGQDKNRVRQFADKLNVTYPVIAGNPGMVRQFKPKGFPTTILYDGTGKQVWFKEGPVTRQEVESILSK